jgi:hypothetical protein
VPLRFHRPVLPVIAAGVAAAWVVAGSAPAFADQVRQQEWWLSALHVTSAWHATRGAGVTVAVLSDGVDAAQPDLGDAVTAGPDFTHAAESTSAFVGGTGTEVASLIAGRGTGHGAGVIGIAPKARILSIRVTLDPADPALDSAAIGAGLPAAIAAGIRYAVAHHAKVIDLPTDPGEPSPSQLAALPIPPAVPGEHRPTKPLQLAGLTAAAGGSSAEEAAVAYARHKDVVLIAPAGDNGAGTDAANYPAAYPGVIAVGAFGQAFTSASYSSHQPYVALTGPGTDVIAASSAGGDTTISSTNAASAVVSGIAALIRSKYPQLTAKQVGHILTRTAVYRTAGPSAPGQGSGTVDAGRALASAAALTAPADARAGAGAVSFASPATPGIMAPVTSNGLAPRILRAAIISAALLVLLLLAVLAYRAAGRRRERKDTAAAAEWARSTQDAFSPYGDQEADRMLEFFAAAETGLAPQAAPFSPFAAASANAGAGAGGGQAAGRDAEASAGGNVATDASQPSSGSGGSGGPGGAVGPGVGAWVPLGAAARTHGRQVRVSGAPPWEPAAEPASALPWAAVPGAALAPGALTTRSAAASMAAGSIWPTAATTPTAPTAPSPSGGWAWEDLAIAPAGPPDTQSFTPSRDAAAGSQSPSGSDWELPAREQDRADEAPDTAGSSWPPADSDAYRPPAAGLKAGLSPGAPAAASGGPGDTAAVPDDARPWSTDGTSGIFRWAPGPSAAAQTSPWAPGAAAEATAAPAAQPPAESSWEPARPDSSWEPARPDSSWEPARPDSSWEPARPDSSWDAPAPGSPTPDSPTPDSPTPDWNAPPLDSGWDSAGTQARLRMIDAQGSDAPGSDAPGSDAPGTADWSGTRSEPASGDADGLYAWRPSDQTETFPVLGDD